MKEKNINNKKVQDSPIDLYNNNQSYDKTKIYHEVDGLSLQNLFFVTNGYFPNCYMFTKPQKSGSTYFDTPRILEHLKEISDKEKNFMKSVIYTTYDIETQEKHIGISIIFPERNLFARFENSISESYILYGHDNGEDVKWLVDEIRQFYKTEEIEKNNIFLISQGPTGFGLTKWNINEVADFDVEKQYNDDFKKQSEIIDNFITSEEKSGLIILHGEKGTGKSTYIRHLVNQYQDKRFIFVHSGLVGLLGEPTFNNFLLSLSDSVIILEDCEDALKARKAAGSSAAVGVLLNMTDGLLADTLHIKFICTFNEDISSIDDALLRKGRLVCKYEFSKLNKIKANALLQELYGNMDKVPSTEKDMSLADIYNYNDDSYERKKSNFI